MSRRKIKDFPILKRNKKPIGTLKLRHITLGRVIIRLFPLILTWLFSATMNVLWNSKIEKFAVIFFDAYYFVLNIIWFSLCGDRCGIGIWRQLCRLTAVQRHGETLWSQSFRIILTLACFLRTGQDSNYRSSAKTRHERCRIIKCSRPVSSRLSKQYLRFLRQTKKVRTRLHVRKARNLAKIIFYFLHLDVFINKRLLALITYKNNISSDNYVLTYIPLVTQCEYRKTVDVLL